MSGLEERERAVELYFTTPMTTAQVVEHLGYPTRQCLEHWLRWIPGMPAIWPNPSSHWRPGEGQSSRCRVACRSGPPNSSARASARCMAGSGRTARAAWPRCSPKTGTPRRAISPLTPVAGRPQPMMMTRRLCAAGSRNRNRGNALMREVAEARRKRPRRRPAAPVEQGEDPVDRPVEAGVFARLDDMPARHRAERPPMCKTCKFLPVCGGGCAYRNESIHPTCLRSIFENNELRILKEHLAKEYSYNCKTNMK